LAYHILNDALASAGAPAWGFVGRAELASARVVLISAHEYETALSVAAGRAG
jgi:hypothetical protein